MSTPTHTTFAGMVYVAIQDIGPRTPEQAIASFLPSIAGLVESGNVIESWCIQDPAKDKSARLGFGELNVGAWIFCFKARVMPLFSAPPNDKKCGTCIHFLHGTLGGSSICIIKTDNARNDPEFKGMVTRSSNDTACPSYAKTK